MFYRYEHSMSISPISHMAIFVNLITQHNVLTQYIHYIPYIHAIMDPTDVYAINH